MKNHQEAVDDKVVDAVLNAYYPQLVASATAARSRAQAAYTVASATAAALVAAGVLTDISSFGFLIQASGGLALAAWIVAAALFMEVWRRDIPKGEPELLDAQAFVVRAMNDARCEESVVEGRLGRALVAARVALGLTLVALILVMTTRSETPAALSLTREGQAAVQDVCPEADGTLSGKLDLGSLDGDFASVEVAAADCSGRDQTVLVPVESIESAVYP